ncbi:histidinol-phosphate aminotransferase [Methanomicrobium sp. W14]|uniref:pyridoxal phosphate-dependent aminotransferase n=1 Tax=Methanomicrobium sp. W14 TaxID=2817839 RepID=UPI001AE4A19B|nr:histidinol-phosphate transaminase [Methanomicrobium sp. W14]MBP2134565.1 histidinol-phosphate aminotransferase [Methanomicrobium sp. W14]
MKNLIRKVFEDGGYVFATNALVIAKNAGFENPARLASNENPKSPSKYAVEEAVKSLDSLNRYPDETAEAFVGALNDYHGQGYNIVTGVGMDGVIETVVRTLVDCKDKVCISTPTFSFYGLSVRAQGGEAVNVRRENDFTVDCDRFIERCKGAKFAILCTPNNPTGTVTPVADIEYILKRIDCMLFLDNAYVDFCDTDYRPLMEKYDNLIIGRTMSKAFGLAGMRVGYAFVPEWFMPYFLRAQTPFALNSVAIAAASGALKDREYVRDYLSHVKEWRSRFEKESGYPVYPSGSNFVMIDVSPMKGDDAMRKLAEKGVIVRSCASFPTLGDTFIRVSVGDDWENELFLKSIKEI